MTDREAIALAVMRAMVVATSAAVECSRSLGWRERIDQTLTTTTTTEPA